MDGQEDRRSTTDADADEFAGGDRASVDAPVGAPAAYLREAELVDVFIALRPRLERVVANRVGCHATAADLVQDLYLRLPRIGERLPDSEQARRYLLRMAVNAAINHLSIEGRRAELLNGITDLYEISGNSPEDAALTADQLRIVEAALRQLPEKCREMLYLSRVEGLKHSEIATRMSVSRSLVEKYLVKALLHCRACLQEST